MPTDSFVLTSRMPFTVEDTELYELTELAGITIDPIIFKCILGLLRLNVQPKAIVELLKRMCHESVKAQKSSGKHSTKHISKMDSS